MSIFFTSPIGLGHATRDIAIAERLLLQDDLIFVSGEAAVKLIKRKGYKVLDVYRPEKFIVESGQLQHSFKWLMNYYSYYKKCKEIAKAILEKNISGLIISDEDFASITIGEAMGRKRVLITDILETHFTSGAASLIEKKMNKGMQKMIQACDCVIIPDVGYDKDNIRYVGPIVRQVSADRDTLRKRFNFNKNTIIVSIGGTDAGRYLIEKAIEAHKKLKLKLDSELVLVSGPSVNLPNSPEYCNLGFVDNLHELIYAADLVISLAGRSTIDESVAYGTPGIFIPIRNHFEQEQGAARMGYKYDDIFRLESLIEEKLGQRNNKSNAVNASGAERAAKIISTLLH